MDRVKKKVSRVENLKVISEKPRQVANTRVYFRKKNKGSETLKRALHFQFKGTSVLHCPRYLHITAGGLAGCCKPTWNGFEISTFLNVQNLHFPSY